MIFSYKAKQSQQVTALTRGGNEKARDTLNNVSEGKDINEIEGALQVGVEEGKGSKIYYENERGNDKETIGFNDKTTGESYINGATEYENEEGKKVSAVTDTNELIKVDAHEQSHKYTENETIADIAGSEAKSAWAITNWIYGDSINTSGTATSNSWLSQQMNNTSSLSTLVNNTVEARNVSAENRLNDIAFNIDPNGAGGNGHLGLYFQDQDKNWYRYDQGADIEADNPPSNLEFLLNFGFKEGISIENVNLDTNDIKIMQTDTNFVYVKTTEDQDIKITEKAFNNMNTTYQRKYRLWTNNCVDSIQTVVDAGDLNSPIDFDPRPNQYFEKIKSKYIKEEVNNEE